MNTLRRLRTLYSGPRPANLRSRRPPGRNPSRIIEHPAPVPCPYDLQPPRTQPVAASRGVPVTSGRESRRAARPLLALGATSAKTATNAMIAIRMTRPPRGTKDGDGAGVRRNLQVPRLCRIAPRRAAARSSPSRIALAHPVTQGPAASRTGGRRRKQQSKAQRREAQSGAMAQLLASKIVCITGASRGIGRACAVECARHGATGLILHYFGDDATTKEVESLKSEIESLHTHCKVVYVPGDIAQRATSLKVRFL